MKSKYFEIKLPFGKENFQELETALALYGNLSWLEEDGMFAVCFESKKEAGKFRDYIKKIPGFENLEIPVSEHSNKDWNKEWEASIQPVSIGGRMIIYPSWLRHKLTDTEGKILLEIDPKMAFGTGHNETTQIVLELMARYLKGNEEKLLDFGCGTGILAIAGIKLGVSEALAIDNDPEAVAAALECVKKNEVHRQVRIQCSGIDEVDEDEFDIICANILSSVIIENMEHISARAAKGARLFLSGILMNEDEEIMDHVFSNEFDVEDIMSKGQWMGLYAVKR